jgi:hypothetical protein
MIQSKNSERSRRRKAEGERISKIVNDVIESDETKWEYVTGAPTEQPYIYRLTRSL